MNVVRAAHVACLSVWGLLVSACCSPSAVKVTTQSLADGTCSMRVEWDGAGALGMYVVPPEMKGKIPRGWNDFNGRVYWGLDTTKFPDGFIPPVTVGKIPRNAEDSKIAKDKEPIEGSGDTIPYLTSGDVGPLLGMPVVVAVVTVPGTLYFDEMEMLECDKVYGEVPLHFGME